MENINTLHIVGHLPSNKIPIAGQIISYNWLLNSKESKCKYLLVLCNNRELEYKQDLLNELCGELEIIPISRNKKFLNFLLNINQPYLTANRISANVKKRIHLIIKQYAIKKVVYEFTSTYGYYLYLKNTKPLEHSFIAHDISFQALHRKYKKFKWIKKLFYYFEYRRVKTLRLSAFMKTKFSSFLKRIGSYY